jgi:DNA (cytosine-5)-methyltransferase 1
VSEVFRLLDKAKPRWLVLENVPFMLQLERGEAMRFLTNALEERRYRWAYRVVDTRAFGLPQRRQRVLVLASRTEDPRPVLLSDDAGDPVVEHPYSDQIKSRPLEIACGFYWTEGVRGLGWAVDAVPTLKGGSTIGIPSPPAIVLPTGEVVTPDIRDAERLQGFPADWTAPSVDDPSRRNGPRWKLVGNAVSVPVFRWVGERLAKPKDYDLSGDIPLSPGATWPRAAWNMGDGAHAASVSSWPKRSKHQPLAEFLKHPGASLSLRATRGFLYRAGKGTLRFPGGFLDAVMLHARRMSADSPASEVLPAHA